MPDENVANSVRNNAFKLGITPRSIYDWNRKFKIFETRDYSLRRPIYSDEFISLVLRDVVSVGGGEKIYKR